ncbi:VTC domain-containing protein [Brachybacterium nesterenkovii]|uniref:VTC domain-containing protein n=1 Tax=Brachybacterium nesterenkovii TaxID=47847 RepID=A0A1X6X3E4_9MICO|nr:VTC domain-containing protein [Brachybacterium nesterenkovii]SLM93321.1 hypothetical protein FM110_09665 [Brachybacterium nesterenkovii]
MTAADRPHGRRAARMPQPISVRAALAEATALHGIAELPPIGLDELPPIGLDELTARASLMTRTDRKYLVPIASAHRLLHALDGDVRVLEIGGARTFGYRSTYYDTADLVSYRTAATGRRRRFKVRRRDYLDTGASFLEVKTLTGRGQSAKVRAELAASGDRGAMPPAPAPAPAPARTTATATAPAPALPLPSDTAALTGALRKFVDTAVADAGVPSPEAALLPQLRTEYDRTTLLVESEGARLTIDGALTWTDLLTGAEADAEESAPVPPRAAAPDAGRHQLAGMVVVETKSGSRAGTADRLLWLAGHRPVRISKYATGLALLRGDLSANRWHRTLGTLRAA